MRRQSQDPLAGIVPVFVILGLVMFVGEIVAQYLTATSGGPK